MGTGDRRLTEFLQICIDMELGLTQIYRALIGKLKLGAEIRDFCADLENAGQRTAERFQDEGLRVAAAKRHPSRGAVLGPIAEALHRANPAGLAGG